MGKVNWFGDKVFKRVEDKSERAVRKTLRAIERDARQGCPKGKTGKLRDSIKAIYFHRARSPRGIVRAVGDEKDGYAPQVEFGHQTPGGNWVAPRQFLRPALEKHKKTLQRNLKIR